MPYTLREHLEALSGDYKCDEPKVLAKMDLEVTSTSQRNDCLYFDFEDNSRVTAKLLPPFSAVKYKVF